MNDHPRSYPDSLMDAVAAGEGDRLADLPETAWIEVIRKMDEVYSDLIRYEVDLEAKNSALEQARQFIASVLSSMSDILIVCDQKGLIQQVNPALLGMTGFAACDLEGQPLSVLLDGDHLKEFHPGAVVSEHEATLKAKGGGYTDYVALNCSPRLDRTRRLPGMVIVGRPIGELRRAYGDLHAAHSDLKLAQQQLIQAEKMASLGRLVAGVAHELNNPISFVYGNVHALSRYRQKLTTYLDAVHNNVPEAERDELRRRLRVDDMLADLGPLIDGTLEGAQRVSEIVRNLRRLSFANPGERHAFDFSEVARNAVQWVLKAAKRRIVLDDALPDHLMVKGLEGPLHQVIVNLTQNAIDAMEDTADPVLSISGRRHGDQVVVVVRDNGPGIVPDGLSKVFDPFFTTKPVGKGTGLGLWVSWSIVRDQGGVIEAANAPDGGAAFTLILPTG